MVDEKRQMFTEAYGDTSQDISLSSRDASAILSFLSAHGAGAAASTVVQDLHLTMPPEVLQDYLERLVHSAVLERRGVGRGALYTLSTASMVEQDLLGDVLHQSQHVAHQAAG